MPALHIVISSISATRTRLKGVRDKNLALAPRSRKTAFFYVSKVRSCVRVIGVSLSSSSRRKKKKKGGKEEE